MTPRPVALTVTAATIPDALRRESRWMLWRYEARAERWTKVCCTPAGRHAKTNDPSTWTTFDDALAAYQTGRFDGVGFCLGDGWAGVDLDHCREHDAYTAPGPLARLACYVEISPSDTGAKAIGRASRIGGQIDFGVTPIAFTAWSSARFFAITGRGSGDPCADITDVVNDWFPPPPPVSAGRQHGYEAAADLSDDDLLLQAVGAPNGDKFLALWRGDTTAYGGDRSRADQALVCLLAFWTNYDVDRVDRLFRASGLSREKWNTHSYRTATLQKALS